MDEVGRLPHPLHDKHQRNQDMADDEDGEIGRRIIGPLVAGALIAGLLRNQVAVHDLTAEAVLTQSKEAAWQALLLDPVVYSARAAEQTISPEDMSTSGLDTIRLV